MPLEGSSSFSVPEETQAPDQSQETGRASFEHFDFEKELQRVQPILYATALKYMRDAQAATEVAHDASIRAFMKIDQLREPKAFVGWVRQIVVRLCLNRLTRRKIHQAEEGVLENEPSLDKRNDPAFGMLTEEQQRMVRSSLERISHFDRDTLMAFYFHGQSVKEISELLQIPEGTVKRRLHVARNRYKTVLLKSAYFLQGAEFSQSARTPRGTSTKKLATSSKSTNVASMSNNHPDVPTTADAIWTEFKHAAKKDLGTCPIATFTDFQDIATEWENDADVRTNLKRQYGKGAVQLMETYSRKLRAILNPTQGKTPGAGLTMMALLRSKTKTLSDLTSQERATFRDELLEATTDPKGPGYDGLLLEFGLTDETFGQLYMEDQDPPRDEVTKSAPKTTVLPSPLPPPAPVPTPTPTVVHTGAEQNGKPPQKPATPERDTRTVLQRLQAGAVDFAELSLDELGLFVTQVLECTHYGSDGHALTDVLNSCKVPRVIFSELSTPEGRRAYVHKRATALSAPAIPPQGAPSPADDGPDDSDTSPKRNAEFVLSSVLDDPKGKNAFAVLYAAADMFSENADAAKRELLHIFSLERDAIAGFDLPKLRGALDVLPTVGERKGKRYPAAFKKALVLLYTNPQWAVRRSKTRLLDCVDVTSPTILQWMQDTSLEQAWPEDYAVPMKLSDVQASHEADDDASPTAPAPAVRPVQAAASHEHLEHISAASEAVQIEQLTREMTTLRAQKEQAEQSLLEMQAQKEQSEKSLQALQQQMEELRAQMESVLTTAPQQSVASQVLEVTPDEHNTVRVVVEVKLKLAQ